MSYPLAVRTVYSDASTTSFGDFTVEHGLHILSMGNGPRKRVSKALTYNFPLIEGLILHQ